MNCTNNHTSIHISEYRDQSNWPIHDAVYSQNVLHDSHSGAVTAQNEIFDRREGSYLDFNACYTASSSEDDFQPEHSTDSISESCSIYTESLSLSSDLEHHPTMVDLAFAAQFELLRLQRLESWNKFQSDPLTTEKEAYDEQLYSEYEPVESVNHVSARVKPHTGRSTVAHLAIVAGFELLRLQKLESNGDAQFTMTLDDYTRTSSCQWITPVGEDGSSIYVDGAKDGDALCVYHESYPESLEGSDEEEEDTDEMEDAYDDVEMDVRTDCDADVSDNDFDDFTDWDF